VPSLPVSFLERMMTLVLRSGAEILRSCARDLGVCEGRLNNFMGPNVKKLSDP
jgi:hypothetical protein